MPKIVWDPNYPGGSWASSEDKILIGERKEFGDVKSVMFSHEVGHWQLGHKGRVPGNFRQFLKEIEAWTFALERTPPEEINLDYIEDCLDSFLEGIYEPEEEEAAKKLMRNLLALARRKKRDA